MKRWLKKYAAHLMLLILLSLTAIPFEAIAGSIGPAAAFRNEVLRTSTGEAPLVSVMEAKDLPGQLVTVQGVVVKNQVRIRGGKRSVHIQDETGGIHIYDYRGPDAKAGNRIQVTGVVGDRQGLLEIRPTAAPIQVLQKNKSVPAPSSLQMADLNHAGRAEALKGQLVKLPGQMKELPAGPTDGVYRIPVADEAGNVITLVAMEGLLDLHEIRVGGTYEITGILSQYETYEIIPQSPADLVAINPNK